MPPFILTFKLFDLFLDLFIFILDVMSVVIQSLDFAIDLEKIKLSLITAFNFVKLINCTTGKSRFKKLHFSFLKSRVVWFKKDLCTEFKNSSYQKKNALCTYLLRWICKLQVDIFLKSRIHCIDFKTSFERNFLLYFYLFFKNLVKYHICTKYIPFRRVNLDLLWICQNLPWKFRNPCQEKSHHLQSFELWSCNLKSKN